MEEESSIEKDRRTQPLMREKGHGFKFYIEISED